jgi:Uma2 family endonuclease
VIELRFLTDNLKSLQEKMQEYLNSGLLLGWLINPQDQKVEIYRCDLGSRSLRDRDVEIVDFPVSLSGANVLPDFSLDLPLS